MANRGLLIAVQEYPDATDVTNNLAGTQQVASAFRDWLITQKGVEADAIAFCTEAGVPGRTSGTTKPEILDEVERLLDVGRDRTEQLFVLFAGHGVGYTQDVSRQSVDILLTAEYRDAGRSGDACLKVGEFVEALWHAFGPGEHFYFLDCCRSAIDRDSIRPNGLGRRFNPSARAKPSRGLLFAVPPGGVATTNSKFEEALMAGLGGDGVAKTWEEPYMWVTWSSLVKYVSSHASGVEPITRGDSSRLLLQIDPIPEYKCTVRVPAAGPNEPHRMRLLNGRGDVLAEEEFQGPEYEFKRRPTTLQIELSDSQGPLQRVTLPDRRVLDLFQDLDLEFARDATRDLGPGFAGPGPGPAPGRVSIVASPTNREIRVEDLSSGTVSLPDSGSIDLDPGTYAIEMRDDSGSRIRRSEVHIPEGGEVLLDRWAAPESPVRESVAGHFPSDDHGIDFSESLGWTASADTQVWLAIIGASRIVGPDQFSKLGPLPLTNFHDLLPGESGVYVLAGLGDVGYPQAGLTTADGTVWLDSASAMPHVHEVRIDAEPGPCLVSVRLPDRLPMTVASHCSPNRVTLIVVTDEGRGEPELSQYMLPPGHLVQELPAEVQDRLGGHPLQAVRFISLSQSLFRAGHRLEPEDGGRGDRDPGRWEALLYGKWVEPLMAIMASYQMLREGQDVVEEAISNLGEFFGDIPDVQALLKMTGRSDAPVQGVPVIRDGLLALDDESLLPFSSGSMAYHDFWTMWTGVA